MEDKKKPIRLIASCAFSTAVASTVADLLMSASSIDASSGWPVMDSDSNKMSSRNLYLPDKV